MVTIGLQVEASFGAAGKAGSTGKDALAINARETCLALVPAIPAVFAVGH